MTLPYIVLAFVLSCMATFAVGEWDGRDRAKAACEARALEFTVAQAEAHVAALAAANRKADTLTARLAAAETRTRTVYKEVVREIPAVTFDRPCLGATALGLLDRLAVAAPGMPQTAGQPADTSGGVALAASAAVAGGDVTDTQIAGWIADVTDQHERERQRCNALIEWHQ